MATEPVVGTSPLRRDAESKVTGAALYPGDIDLQDQLWMKVLFARRGPGIIRSLDTSAAAALPGVVAVFTARDVPNNEFGLHAPDAPVLVGPGSPKVGADRIRSYGDQIAVIVAEDEAIAERARDLITFQCDDLPAVMDPIAAMANDAALVHPELGTNIYCHYPIRKGDVEAAFERCDAIVEAEYVTQAQEHAFLQPEAGLSYVDDDGRITVVTAGQWAHEDRQQIAQALGLAEDRVRVIYAAIGGAFGGREDMSVQITLALAAMRLRAAGIHRPIKMIWTRNESMIGHYKRHPFIIRAKWGATRAGQLIAVKNWVVQDGGAYLSTSRSVLGNGALTSLGPYAVHHVQIDAYGVYTNNLGNGAFRGFGAPQGTFAAEGQMNRLAEALGIDPVELRVRNAIREGDELSTGGLMPPATSIADVVAHTADTCGWREGVAGWSKPELAGPTAHVRRGIGFACAFKNVAFSFGSPEECVAIVELHGADEVERLVLRHAAADVGQGSHTVICQMAAEAAGVPLDRVELMPPDTATSRNSGTVAASRMTYMAGHAILGACKLARDRWQAGDRPALGEFAYHPTATTPIDRITGRSEFPYLAYGFVAEAVTVEVDSETGHLHILNVTCGNDVGKAINPELVRGQVEGGVVQAVGYAITEDMRQAPDRVITNNFATYLIPGVLDIPEEIDSVILEFGDQSGPWGARGMGEMPFIPLPAALAAAVHDATGVWFDRLPLSPERIVFGMQEAQRTNDLAEAAYATAGDRQGAGV